MRLYPSTLPVLAALFLVACGNGEQNATPSPDMSPVNDQGAATSDMSSEVRDMTVRDMAASDMGSTMTPDMPVVAVPDAGEVCVDVTVYKDGDGDGYGDGGAMTVCLVAGAPAPAGFARQMGDCRDDDPLAYEGSEGVCNDQVDDSCDGKDEACPASQPNQMSVPSWDCTGQAPPNVYAWARFDDGGGYFKGGGCFVFFEGKKDIFYTQRVNIAPASTSSSCDTRNGCICPSLNGWPSYDRRLYAFTTSGDPDACEEITIVDHGGESQPVSNGCRKYLYQLHFYDIPYSHIASSLEGLERRLDTFSTVEIACVREKPHANLPFASLLTMAIQKNDGFQKQ